MNRTNLQRRAILAAFVIAIGGSPAVADLGKPTGEVILTITGNIKKTNAPGKAEFDRAMLNALGVSTIETSHSWGDGVAKFEGVTAAKILDAVEAQGSKLRAAAVNDYAIDLDVSEMRKYPVLLATHQNGTELRLRDRGPLWIVYPRDQFPELKDEKHNFKWIWQLKSIEVR
jgi:hypothetical protein